MADLNELQASGATKIVGSDVTGAEQNYVNADSNGNMLVKNYANGPVTPGAVAAQSSLGGGQFNTSLPTLSNGQQSAIQVDSSARQIIAPLTNASVIKAQLQDNAGTAITLGQKAMTASVPVVLASDQAAIPVTQSGTWTVQQGTPPWSVGGNVAAGATDSGNPVKIGGKFNTALPTLTNGQRGDLQLDSSSRAIIAPLTNTSVVKAQLQDNAGNALTSINSQLQVNDTINAGTGTQGALTVGTSAVNVRVGGSNLANRKLVTLHNNSLLTWYWGYTNGVTSTNGTPLLAGQFIGWAVGPGQDIFVITTLAGQNGRVTEGA